MVMKTRRFFRILAVALAAVVGLGACGEKDGREVTSYEEYELTVASREVPGVVTSCGNSVYSHLFAVKREGASEWEALGGIGKFEFEEGYEYELRVSETHYLDYDMGEPAWEEYELLEVLSKVKKESEGLPLHFVPDWYFESCFPYVDSEFAFAVEADDKEAVESAIKADEELGFGGRRFYVSLRRGDWFLLDKDMSCQERGDIIRKSREPEDLPESYKLLVPDGNVVGTGHYDFARLSEPEDVVLGVDVFVTRASGSKSVMPQSVCLWLYRDLTEVYKARFPEAGVRAVAVRYEVKGISGEIIRE